MNTTLSSVETNFRSQLEQLEKIGTAVKVDTNFVDSKINTLQSKSIRGLCSKLRWQNSSTKAYCQNRSLRNCRWGWKSLERNWANSSSYRVRREIQIRITGAHWPTRTRVFTLVSVKGRGMERLCVTGGASGIQVWCCMRVTGQRETFKACCVGSTKMAVTGISTSKTVSACGPPATISLARSHRKSNIDTYFNSS